MSVMAWICGPHVENAQIAATPAGTIISASRHMGIHDGCHRRISRSSTTSATSGCRNTMARLKYQGQGHCARIRSPATGGTQPASNRGLARDRRRTMAAVQMIMAVFQVA